MTVTWATTTRRHGTHSGWSLHQRLGERPCDACLRAKQAYDARWRAAPERQRRNRASAKAQRLAYAELAHMFPELYRRLYDEYRTQIDEERGLNNEVES